MTKQVKPIPEGYHTITPHLSVNGAAKFADFLKRAFGAVERMRMPGPDGKLMHVEIQIGDSKLMFSDLFPESEHSPAAEGRCPVVFHVYVPDADKTFAQAISAGCQATMPLQDQFWGDRYGQVKDPFGFAWAIATHKEDLTPEEMQKRRDALFAVKA